MKTQNSIDIKLFNLDGIQNYPRFVVTQNGESKKFPRALVLNNIMAITKEESSKVIDGKLVVTEIYGYELKKGYEDYEVKFNLEMLRTMYNVT